MIIDKVNHRIVVLVIGHKIEVPEMSDRSPEFYCQSNRLPRRPPQTEPAGLREPVATGSLSAQLYTWLCPDHLRFKRLALGLKPY